MGLIRFYCNWDKLERRNSEKLFLNKLNIMEVRVWLGYDLGVKGDYSYSIKEQCIKKRYIY